MFQVSATISILPAIREVIKVSSEDVSNNFIIEN